MTLVAAIVTIAVALTAGLAAGNRRGFVCGVMTAVGVLATGVVGWVILVASMKM